LTNNIPTPAPIVLSGVTAIAAGFGHSLFLKSDGSLWAMGYNGDGELGDGTFNNSFYQEEIVPSGVTAISAGGGHSLFIKKHGGIGHVTTELWATGDNEYGQLGDGTSNSTNKPEIILSYTAPAIGSPVTAIAAGGYHSLFLKNDGSLWAMGADNWIAGDDGYGQLGDGTTNATSDVPEEILPGGVTAIAAGTYHSLFIKSDGSLWAMGNDETGQLGDGTIGTAPPYGTNRPEQVVTSGVTAIAAGTFHSLLIRQGGLWGMGGDDVGQLGDDTTNAAVDLPELIFGPAPALGITTYGNQPMVFYPTGPAINRVLQMTTNLASPNWVTVTNSVPCTAALITNAPSNAFFRLQ
jgi:alpha-tubulin suppressor-like RCC1 family protein